MGRYSYCLQYILTHICVISSTFYLIFMLFPLYFMSKFILFPVHFISYLCCFQYILSYLHSLQYNISPPHICVVSSNSISNLICCFQYILSHDWLLNHAGNFQANHRFIFLGLTNKYGEYRWMDGMQKNIHINVLIINSCFVIVWCNH